MNTNDKYPVEYQNYCMALPQGMVAPTFDEWLKRKQFVSTPQQSDWEKEFDEQFKMYTIAGGERKEWSASIDIKDFITSEIEREREKIINILKVVHGEQFSDEVHCTCLAYAIDALEGKSDESKENLKRLQGKVNTQ